ncbi:MAG TPA: T9SS type A sorting domain-containing protein, partial [Bacteroidia bacterium]|nr:T9SS type A sorting domain-containing protein [Bacteroidia bacterium]
VVSSTQLGCPDACAAMMPNGIILCDFSPAGTYNTPTYFYEYDYTTNKFTQVSVPGGGTSINTSAFATNMLDLPDGTVLFADQGDNDYYQYTPKGSPLASGKPVINSIIEECPTFMITGKLFNGISEGAGYGDDWQCATNYPIVRLTNGTNVYYAKTTNWNRIGAVMTDSLMDTAYFTIPTMPAGTYSVVVVANGIPSSPHSLTLPCVTTYVDQVELPGTNYITVYPNPGNGIFSIESSIPIDKSIICVYNTLGQELMQQKMNGSLNTLDLSGQPAGVYLYHVLSEQGELLGKGKFVIKK